MPEAPSVSQHYRDAIRNIRPDWDIQWRQELRRFAVVKVGQFKGKPQGIVQMVCQEDDGSFRQVDQRLVDYVRQQVYRERTGYYDPEQVRARDEAIPEQARHESENDLEAHRDEAVTRVRMANWHGRKR
jgi:hypothetical protein